MRHLISVWEVIRPNFNLGWNLLLALVPLVLSRLLFEENRRRDWVWWLGAGMFAAFLPNAPYALTDVVHLLAKIRIQPRLPDWAIVLLFIEFSLYCVVCFQAYVWSLTSLVAYVGRNGLRSWSVAIELSVNALCAVGIYLGRFQRLNSWDIVTAPERVFHHTVHGFVHRRPAETILLAFLVIAALYYIFKAIDLAIHAKLTERYRAARP
jgi:uncharacterized membrane protein